MNALIAWLIVSAAVLQPATGASTSPLVAEVVVNAPVERLWDAFTTKAGMESWMVGSGDIDLSVGGLMRTSYQRGADLEGDTAIHQRILSLDPGRMLSYRTVKSPEAFPFAAGIGQTWTVIYFEPVDSDHTKVTVKMLGFTTHPESQKMRAFFETGNKTTLDALVRRLAMPDR